MYLIYTFGLVGRGAKLLLLPPNQFQKWINYLDVELGVTSKIRIVCVCFSLVRARETETHPNTHHRKEETSIRVGVGVGVCGGREASLPPSPSTHTHTHSFTSNKIDSHRNVGLGVGGSCRFVARANKQTQPNIQYRTNTQEWVTLRPGKGRGASLLPFPEA